MRRQVLNRLSGKTAPDGAIPIENARLFPHVNRPAPGALTVASATLCVGATASVLWLGSGVRLGEIARFVPFELAFVLAPGWLAYRALMSCPGGHLRQLVFGWSLGYFLEILAFIATAAAGVRGLFLAYPVAVGAPAGFIALRRRRNSTDRAEISPWAGAGISVASVWLGALLCAVLLVNAASVGFTQTPLPRDLGSATYQEDTVFTIAIAAEALHHWPVTLPSVAGEPLNYHLFAYMNMAAISQVTGIDLSVVVMRLHIFPLLLLFALQLILAGRRVGRGSSAGLVAAFFVLFLGELDASVGMSVPFRDFLFYWLQASYTFLLGLIFFVPTVVLLTDLITSRAGSRSPRAGRWALVGVFLVACIGTKSYAPILVLGGGLVIFALWQYWRERTINRPAILALGLSGALYVIANTVVFKWNTGGAIIDPLTVVRGMEGVGELRLHVERVWGSGVSVESTLGVAYGTFGLLGIPAVGIALLFRYKSAPLTAAEVWFLSLFITGLPALYVLSQPGDSQLFLVFFSVVPGAILAASGFRLFWVHHARASVRVATIALVSGVAWTVATARILDTSPRVQLQLTFFWLLVVGGTAAAVGARWQRTSLAASVVAFAGLVVINTPMIRYQRLTWNAIMGPTIDGGIWFKFWSAIALISVPIVVLAVVCHAHGPVRRGLMTAVVGGCLSFAVLNTPLDWFPLLARRAIDGKPLYEQEFSGLTSGLYSGLLWIRSNSDPNAVLVVNNHSLRPDEATSKYFYYSAFAQRRVVLESWDYTAQTAARGVFSLDAAHSPFPRRLKLSNEVFDGDESALKTLVRDYGASYLVADKVHGNASSGAGRLGRLVFSNRDIDVYAVGIASQSPGSTPCARARAACGTATAGCGGRRAPRCQPAPGTRR